MKIAMNALFFRFPTTGSGQYLTHMLKALDEVDAEHEYVLLGLDPLPQGYALNERFRFVQLPVPNLVRRSLVLEKLLWEQYAAPAGASRVKADLFHVPFFAPPYFSRTPNIATIHDIIPVRLPVYRDSPRMRAYMRLVTRAARKSSLIITVSQHAKKRYSNAGARARALWPQR